MVENKEKYKRLWIFISSLIELTMMTELWAVIWYTYYSEKMANAFFRRGHWLVLFIYALLLFMSTQIYDGYRVGYYKCGNIIYSSCLSTLFANGIIYLQTCLLSYRLLPLWPMLALTAADVLYIILWANFSDWIYRLLFPPHNILLIYGSSQAEDLVKKMGTRPDKYNIREMVSIDRGIEEICRKIDRYPSVMICDVKSIERNELLKYCFSKSVRTYLTPKISDMIVRGADEIHMFDTPLLLCRNYGLTFEQQILKRCIDILFALTMFVATGPFMLITALAIKLYDGGPVLYKQKRYTQNGRIFEIYKFRSMIADAEKESGARLSTKNDDRITPVGKVIRRIRCDELPQLFNILKGDMSVVGPRPERPEIAAEYEKEIPEFSYRLKVKAGLTGYAQILGKYNTTPYDKLKLDIAYIENYSVFLDIKIILMTIKTLFLAESTEGVEETQKEEGSEKSD